MRAAPATDSKKKPALRWISFAAQTTSFLRLLSIAGEVTKRALPFVQFLFVDQTRVRFALTEDAGVDLPGIQLQQRDAEHLRRGRFGTGLATIATEHSDGSSPAPVLAEKRRRDEEAAASAVVAVG